jgi:GNAT superfamily N-acetyltransferase
MNAAIECRPLTASDVGGAVAMFEANFHQSVPSEVLLRYGGIVNHFLRHDPTGCWAVECDGELVGFAIGSRRDDLWVFAAFYVRPDRQSSGVGRRLFERLRAHGADAPRGMFTSSGDPRATRLYIASGMAVHPSLFASGAIDRSTIPAAQAAAPREGGLDDIELMTAIDREVRGSTRVVDLDHLIRTGARALISESSAGRGYVLFRDGLPPVDCVPIGLVATDLRPAEDLLWAAMAESSSTITVGSLTSSRAWAMHIAVRAGLRLMPGGPLFLRGMEDLRRPWLRSDVFG